METYYKSKYSLISNMRGDSVVVDQSVFSYGKRLGLSIPMPRFWKWPIERIERVKRHRIRN